MMLLINVPATVVFLFDFDIWASFMKLNMTFLSNYLIGIWLIYKSYAYLMYMILCIWG